MISKIKFQKPTIISHCTKKCHRFFFLWRCRDFNDERSKQVQVDETLHSGKMSFKFNNSVYEEYETTIKLNDTQLYLDVQ